MKYILVILFMFSVFAEDHGDAEVENAEVEGADVVTEDVIVEAAEGADIVTEDVAVEDKHKKAYDCAFPMFNDCSKTAQQCQLQEKFDDYVTKLQCAVDYHNCFGAALENCPVEQE